MTEPRPPRPNRPDRPDRPERPDRRPPRPDRPDPAHRRPRAEADPYDYDSLFVEDPADDANSGSMRGRLRASKKLIRRLAVAGAFLLVLVIAAILVGRQLDPPGDGGAQISVRIPNGSSTAAIAGILDENGVVPSAIAFRLWSKYEGDQQFMAGEYAFHRNSSVGAAIAVLRSGPKQTVDRLLIPEGLRLTQIAERVGRLPNMSGSKFLELAGSGKVRSEYQPPASKNLEGLLFPDTYFISPSDTEESLLRRMVNTFGARARVAGIENSLASIQKSPYEALIIASLIEAEAKIDADRGKMSQAIQNRLFKAMPLQIDATILYALNYPQRGLTNSDLKVVSPYNTYENRGLPPTPIGNPGLDSIRAALAPSPGPWLFWVLIDSDGSSAFSVTLDEHNRNIALARQRGVL